MNEQARAPSGVLEGKSAVVFGGTGRIGYSAARSLAESGASVLLHYGPDDDPSIAQSLVDELQRSVGVSGRVLSVRGDLRNAEEVNRLVEGVQEQLGGLDLMVNSVHGPWTPKLVADMTWEDWNVHVDAVQMHFNACKAVLPMMRKRGGGRIIYISGALSHRFVSGCAAYSAAKAGLNAFCQALALEEAEHGITVNVIAPGKVDPEDDVDDGGSPEWLAIRRQTAARAPLGRIRASDIAAAVLYFASPAASRVTGQILYPSGGEVMS